ncbi:MAG: hypothetical protein K0Q71_4395 [Thermomicrobiales bacterium]|jgi:hypothetical protein|nr:hypothetical protein [Thermomicrobiales bacterium]
MQRPRFAAPGLLIIAILLLVGMAGAAPAAARQDTSPTAATPAAEPQPTEAAAPPAAQPAATPAAPAAPAQSDVVTLVLWYTNPLDQEFIELFPLTTEANFVAGPAPGQGAVGTVTFPEDGSFPTIVLNDTTFETYPRPDGVVERWTWFDDFEGARPGTLVMQLAGLDGTYQNYFGAATMISRDEGGVGGVLVLALRPPSPAAAEPAAEEAAPATDEAAAEAPVTEDAAIAEEEAAQPDATVDPGTEILVEPPIEGEVPAEGEVVTEP